MWVKMVWDWNDSDTLQNETDTIVFKCIFTVVHRPDHDTTTSPTIHMEKVMETDPQDQQQTFNETFMSTEIFLYWILFRDI